MFSLFAINPVKKLKKQHATLLEKAMHAQRNGDIRGYSKLTTDAEAIYQKIQQLNAAQGRAIKT